MIQFSLFNKFEAKMSCKRHLIHDFGSLTSLLVMTTPSLASHPSCPRLHITS